MMYTTSPAFSIPSTSRKVFNDDYEGSPGPMYNTFGLGIRHKSLSFGIGMSKRTQINNGVQKTPAPGQYNPQKVSVKKKITIPKNQTVEKIDKDMPDPGFYDPNYKISKSRLQTYSMGNKYPSIMDDVKDTPGPGAYETARDFRKTISSDRKMRKSLSTFNTTADRFLTIKKAPGPGEYDLLSSNKILSSENKGKFSINPRKLHDIVETPGPGEYQDKKIQLAIKSKLGTTMSGKPKQSSFLPAKTITQNAFGTHAVIECLKKTKQMSPQYKIGSSKRKVFEGNDVPGPLDYIKQNYKPKNTFRATIPYSDRQQFTNGQNPGPGTYEPRQKKSLTYTIPRSQSSKCISTNPGVGRYDVNQNTMSRTAKANKFYTSGRANFVSPNKAGVGDYYIEKKSREPISFAKSERFQTQGQGVPGPGDYYIPSSIGRFNNFGKQRKG